jgi:hypothetical protein
VLSWGLKLQLTCLYLSSWGWSNRRVQWCIISMISKGYRCSRGSSSRFSSLTRLRSSSSSLGSSSDPRGLWSLDSMVEGGRGWGRQIGTDGYDDQKAEPWLKVQVCEIASRSKQTAHQVPEGQSFGHHQ